MKIKICGITNLTDALLAEKLGADFIGFIFHPASPRFIAPEKARSIIEKLSTAKAVGVFVEHGVDEVREIAKNLNLYAVQTYFDCDQHELGPDDGCAISGRRDHRPKLIRALRIQNKSDLTHLNPDDYHADFLLVDTYHAKQMGGAGVAFDWSWLPKNLDRVFLAGGITPDNALLAASYRPYALDIASGVESAPGKKDPAKLEKLFYCLK